MLMKISLLYCGREGQIPDLLEIVYITKGDRYVHFSGPIFVNEIH